MVHASVSVVFYAADDPPRGAVVERWAGGDALVAPAHLDVEVVSALRGLAQRAGRLESAVPRALRHLARPPVRRMPLVPLLDRMWELRANVAACDAASVALAEGPGAPLATCDRKLATARGPRCVFELIS